jgi:hypothetical protein
MGKTIVVHNETGLTRPRIGMKLVTVTWRHFAVVAVGLVVVMVVAGILLYPTLYVQYIQEFGIKRFEGQYGFRSGLVLVQSSTSQPERTWGIVSVVPGGTFSRLGVRDGDIPFEYHGGVTDMYAALQQASSRDATSFQVFNAADAHLGAAALRRINLPAAKR